MSSQSPYSYLAHTQLPKIAAEHAATVTYHPFRLLELMTIVGNRPTTIECKNKGKYAGADLQRWTRRYNVEFARNPHSKSFDFAKLDNAALVAIEDGRGAEYVTAVFAAIWGRPVDLSQPSVLSGRPSIARAGRGDQRASGQLDNEIRNLLDAARISAKGVRPQLMWSDPTDIVNAALKQKERKLATHRVVLDVARDVPLVHVDTVLIEQALGQLLENAAKYSPPGSDIKVCSRGAEKSVVLSVTDQGSGLTADEKGQVGRRPFRGRGIGPGGSGLGLWIASTFIAANGGSLHAESRGPGLGTTMSMRLPTVSAETPELLEALDG